MGQNKPRLHRTTDRADSESWIPPLELQAMVAAGALPRAPRAVLELGCGRAVESIFLACVGYSNLYAIDSDAESVAAAERNIARRGVSVQVAQANLLRSPEELPVKWPRQYDLVLDRLCINNVVGALVGDDVSESDARSTYFARVAALMRPGGTLLLRDRWAPDDERRFRRSLFECREEPPREAAPYFNLVPGGLRLSARLIGDDTPDWRRLDAMNPIMGDLMLLRRRGRGREEKPRRRRAPTQARP
jgi:SAM-dependent methyltransferase